MKILSTIMGVMIVLELVINRTLKNIYVMEWIQARPIRLDKMHNRLKTVEAIEINNIHKELMSICEILGIDIPKTYLVADNGSFAKNVWAT